MKTKLKDLSNEQKEIIYLDWINKFITTSFMANYYGYNEDELTELIIEMQTKQVF